MTRDSALCHYAVEINATPLLSHKEVVALAKRIAAGDLEAREHLIRANLRLVVNIARIFVGRGLPLEELVAEGNIGLIHAAELFDGERGTRFSTYASYWIKQNIRHAIQSRDRMVRVPFYMFADIPKWQRAEAALAKSLGRNPTPLEIGKSIGFGHKKIQCVLAAISARGLAQIYADSDHDDADRLEAIAPNDTVADVERTEEFGRLRELVATLPDRLREIITLHFGLDGDQCTLKEIGERLGLTKERVRQLENEALAVLRELAA